MSYVVLRAALPLAVAFGVMVTPVYAAGPNAVMIQIRDECNPATFNLVVGPNVCSGSGAVTFAQFFKEVNQVGRAPQWQFVPAQVRMSVGQTFVATNVGGETHTFTEVDKFGGGFAQFLNIPAGFPTPAPECSNGTPVGTIAMPDQANGGQLLQQGPAFDPKDVEHFSVVPPGGNFQDTEGTNDVGHPVLYQCCIHPWMHEVITVDP